MRHHLVGLVVLALLPAVLFSAAAVALLGAQERRWAERSLTDTARAVASAVDREVTASLTTLDALATSDTLRPGRLAEFHAVASRATPSQRGWDYVFLATPEGEQILNTATELGKPLPPLTDHELVRELRAGRTHYASALSAGPVTGRPSITIGIRVVRGGALAYVLGASFRTDTLNELVAEQRLPSTWTGTIIDGNLVIIARSRTPERYIGQPVTSGLAGRLRRDREGSFWDTTKDGLASFGVFTRTHIGSWIVVLALPASALTAAANRWLATVAVGGIACIALGIGLAVLAARRIARPVAELASLAEAVGDGRVPDHGSPATVLEVTRLGEALVGAARQRQSSEAALREETAALETINRVGQMLSAELDPGRLVQAVTDAATRLTGAAFGAFREHVVEGPIRADDVGNDARYAGIADDHSPVHSYLAVPVVSRSGEVFGSLVFGHPEPGVFTERHERIAVGLAAQAASAMDSARLYERSERARAEAEAANRTKDEFLATLSHELRTPLNAVLGWATLLRHRMGDELAERAVDAIVRNGRAQLKLIEDLLDTSRIVAGKLRLDLHAVDMNAVVEAALEAVQPAATARGIEVRTTLDPGAGHVGGDPDRLQQVVWNLLSNAIKFTPHGGRVEVTLRRAGSLVEVSVTDTGQGIAPSLLPLVFERFRQADSSSTRQHGGLGLGLALVKHLVEMHGGTITAESGGEGAGATFTVRLPSAPGGTQAPVKIAEPEAGAPAVDLTGVRVLAVDDQKETLALWSRLLEDRGATVQIATNAVDGLEAVKTWKPDILISDLEMPGEDGYTFIRKVRALSRAEGGRTFAAAVTAYTTIEHRIRALAAGFETFVAKPVDPKELLAVVANLALRVQDR